MHMQQTDPDSLIEVLDKAISDRLWLNILHILDHTGVADIRHFEGALGMTRGILKRRLDILLVSSLDGEALISEIDHSIKRPAEANRPAAVFRLGKGGARILNRMGYNDAHACELKGDIQILHALSMLSVHLAGEKEKEIEIVTDRNLHYSDDRHFRPDHVVTPPAGPKFLIEIEQEANTKLLPRIMESLANRQTFFQSEEAKTYSHIVRMVFNLKEDKVLYRTMRLWGEAMRQQEIISGQRLGFRIMAIPIKRFLTEPEWEENLSGNWREINPKITETQSPEQEALKELPSAVRPKRPLEQSAALLRALDQKFSQSLPPQMKYLDLGLFSVVREIYNGSHGKGKNTYDDIAGVPIVSIHKLRKYLNDDPKLMAILRRRMHSGRIAWTQTNILHRMGIVIRSFLAYHGWRPSRLLDIYPVIEDGRSYTVKVAIGQLPDSEKPHYFEIEDAFAWVMFALFEYAEDIGLGRPEFW